MQPLKKTVAERNDRLIERFFAALMHLKLSGKIRGIKTFTDQYNINRKSVYCIKAGVMRNLPSWWLQCLVEDYGVSATWLLTGEGPFWN